MINRKQFKNYLMVRKDMVKNDPYYWTKRFLGGNRSIKFLSFMYEVIEYQKLFKCEFTDEREFIFTIL